MARSITQRSCESRDAGEADGLNRALCVGIRGRRRQCHYVRARRYGSNHARSMQNYESKLLSRAAIRLLRSIFAWQCESETKVRNMHMGDDAANGCSSWNDVIVMMVAAAVVMGVVMTMVGMMLVKSVAANVCVLCGRRAEPIAEQDQAHRQPNGNMDSQSDHARSPSNVCSNILTQNA